MKRPPTVRGIFIRVEHFHGTHRPHRVSAARDWSDTSFGCANHDIAGRPGTDLDERVSVGLLDFERLPGDPTIGIASGAVHYDGPNFERRGQGRLRIEEVVGRHEIESISRRDPLTCSPILL